MVIFRLIIRYYSLLSKLNELKYTESVQHRGEFTHNTQLEAFREPERGHSC